MRRRGFFSLGLSLRHRFYTPSGRTGKNSSAAPTRPSYVFRELSTFPRIKSRKATRMEAIAMFAALGLMLGAVVFKVFSAGLINQMKMGIAALEQEKQGILNQLKSARLQHDWPRPSLIFWIMPLSFHRRRKKLRSMLKVTKKRLLSSLKIEALAFPRMKWVKYSISFTREGMPSGSL